VAVYTSTDPDWAFVVSLPTRPVERLVWNAKPEIEPLLEAVDEGERIAVLFFDKERARLFVIALGEIEERQGVFDEVPGKQKTGDWFALSQKRYERHHEDHVLRHLHRTMAVLMDELHRRPFDRLFVAGPPEALSMLMHHLPRPLRLRYSGTLELEWFAPDSEILDAALKAAEAAERQHELDLVNRLLDNLNGQVVLGLEPVLAALWERRVDRLLMTGAIKGPGGRCPACGRLVAGSGPCPVCETEVVPVDDLRAAIIEQALASEAKVEFVEGEAARRLEEHGSIGGWTRYMP
jgi:peptide subunit release factor 1 (eRF1)